MLVSKKYTRCSTIKVYLTINSEQSTVNGQQLTITPLECVCFAVTLDPSHFAVRNGMNLFFFSSPLNIPAIHAFVRRPRSLPRTPSSRTSGGRTVGILMARLGTLLRRYTSLLSVAKPSESPLVAYPPHTTK